MHDGNIHIKSKLGEGSEFIIELPVGLIDEKATSETTGEYNNNPVEKIQIEFSDIYM